MLAVAIGWQVYSIHRNPLDLGLVGLMEFLPLPLLALPAGQLADRLPRRAVTAAAFALNIAIAVLLVFVTLRGRDDALAVPRDRRASPASRTSSATRAARALTPELVPPSSLPSALALRGVAGQIGVIAGPALGGIIFAVEPVAVYATAAGLLTLSLVAVLAMRPVVRSLVTTEPPGWDSLVAGVRFILRTRMLLGAISLDLFARPPRRLDRARARVRALDPPRRPGRARRAAHRAVRRRARRGGAARAQAAAHAGRADAARRRRDLRRRDDRLRASRSGCRSRSPRSRSPASST